MAKKSAPVIVIVGPKHSGKTSAGKALARLCSAEFIDLDELVERRTGKSPRALYREGPEVFRRAEAEALRALLEGEAGGPPEGALIAAAGGGLADNKGALEILNGSPAAITVYIEVPAERAWERIRAAADQSGELPPFLDTEDPRETHRLLHERRSRAYRELAKIAVEAEDSPEETAAKILRRLLSRKGMDAIGVNSDSSSHYLLRR
jgi:shikimate kinase